jgi:hypothetical protein
MRSSIRVIPAACFVVVTSILITPSPAQDRAEAPRLPEDAKWDLMRDFTSDGKLQDAQSTPVQLKGKGSQLSGHFVDKKALGEDNDSTFTGEAVTREKSLILRQEHKVKDGTYVAIHVGHLVGENHYRGTWYDNAGGSGDFELKVIK